MPGGVRRPCPQRVKKVDSCLEIAHVLFIDIVGYSKLSINEQNAAVDEFNPDRSRVPSNFKKPKRRTVDKNSHRRRHGAGVLHQSGSPAQCAVEISRALKEHPAPASADGHSQRSGQWGGGRE